MFCFCFVAGDQLTAAASCWFIFNVKWCCFAFVFAVSPAFSFFFDRDCLDSKLSNNAVFVFVVQKLAAKGVG